MLFDVDSKNFSWGPGEDNDGEDFVILSSDHDLRDHYDFLVFTDSKGMTLLQEDVRNTWTYMFAQDRIKTGYSVLLITRPKIITVFFTLVNFVRNNGVKFTYLVTNLGFVDHTPKKREFLDDIVQQLPEQFPQSELSLKELGTYTLSSGENQLLCSFNYSNISELIGDEIRRAFKFCVLIGIIEFNNTIKISRSRPDCFYDQLNAANEFIFNISKNSASLIFFQYLRAPLYDPEKVSYDAVHFTSFGHKQLFENIKTLLGNYSI